jgi:hypothetical protein
LAEKTLFEQFGASHDCASAAFFLGTADERGGTVDRDRFAKTLIGSGRVTRNRLVVMRSRVRGECGRTINRLVRQAVENPSGHAAEPQHKPEQSEGIEQQRWG